MHKTTYVRLSGKGLSRRVGLALILAVCGSWRAPEVSAARAQVGTSSTFGLNAMIPDLARQLVVMLEPQWKDHTGSPLGAGVIVGVQPKCIYVATADHVIRLPNGPPADSVLVRTAFANAPALTGYVLPNHDAGLDLGVVCIPNAERLLVPFPRLPLTFRGLPHQLAPGELLTFFGNAGGVNWHTGPTPLAFEREESSDVLEVNGAGVELGDSGGGVFAHEQPFLELIGIVARVSGFNSRIISVDAIERRFVDWGLDFAVSDWDYALKHRLEQDGALQSSATLYGQQLASSVLRNIVVMIRAGDGDSNASGSASKVGAGVIGGRLDGRLLVWTSRYLVVAESPPSQPPKIEVALSNGATRSATVLREDETLGVALLAVETTAADLISLKLDSTLPFRAGVSGDLVRGSVVFHVGRGSSGSWEVGPPIGSVLDTGAQRISVTLPGLPPGSRGGGVFNDRNELVGIVVGRNDAGVTDVVRVEKLLAVLAGPTPSSALTSATTSVIPVLTAINGAERQPKGNCYWSKAIGGSRGASFKSVAATEEDVLVAGVTLSRGAGGDEGWILRLSSEGQLLWENTSHHPFNDGFSSVLALSDGSIQVFGAALFSRPTFAELGERFYSGSLSLTFDQYGAMVTTRADNQEADRVEVYASAMEPHGSKVFLAGLRWRREYAVDLQSGAVVRAIDGHGKIVWDHRFDSNEHGGAIGASQSASVIGGFRRDLQSGSENPWLAALDSAGRLLWSRSYELGLVDEVTSVLVLADGTGIAAVRDRSPQGGRISSSLFHFAMRDGALVSMKPLCAQGAGCEIKHLERAKDGAVFAVGYARPTANAIEGWLLKLSADSQILWQKTYAPKYFVEVGGGSFSAVAETAGGDLFIAGEVNVSELNVNAGWILRLDPQGQLDTKCGNN